MIEILQWSTLTLCGALAAARVPSALRGENRTVFYVFALLTLAILLSIEAPYLAVDRALGGMNVANLILRFVIFAAIYFVGIRITRGFGAEDGHRLITGPVGIAALGLVSVAVAVLFFMMDTGGSSAGMSNLDVQDSRNRLLLELYGAAGRAYPAYVSLVLLPAMLRAVGSSLPALVRVAAFLLAAGSVAIALTLLFPVVPPDVGSMKFVINYAAVLCYVIGLALIWMARLQHARGGSGSRTSTAK